ncbi:hypothetical protein CANDROIZ_60013 [Candidatus Roizmanbacteria bacterium]|nr:hypothetical protein CANDROIZ_60013 [Candidatus Roizmanbacteria bacterium]
MPKERKSNYIIKIPKNSLPFIFLIVFLLFITFWYLKNQTASVKNNLENKTVIEPTSTLTPTLNIVNNDLQPATNNTNNSNGANTLTLEQRQKLGQQKAKLEEAIRQTKAEEDRLRKQIEEAKIDCESYTETKDQCLSDIKELENKLNEMIRQNDIASVPLREKISEINALLGI